MFVKALVDLYEKLADAGFVPKDGYTEVKISGKIVLNDNGDIVDIEFHDKKSLQNGSLSLTSQPGAMEKSRISSVITQSICWGSQTIRDIFPVQGCCIWKS